MKKFIAQLVIHIIKKFNKNQLSLGRNWQKVHYKASEANCQQQLAINHQPKLTFQQIAGEIKNNNNNTEALLRNCEPNLVAGVKRPLARPSHLNLSLQAQYFKHQFQKLPPYNVMKGRLKLSAVLSMPAPQQEQTED